MASKSFLSWVSRFSMMLVLSSNQESVSSILVAYWLTLSPSLVMALRTLLPDRVEVWLALGSSASSSRNSLETRKF